MFLSSVQLDGSYLSVPATAGALAHTVKMDRKQGAPEVNCPGKIRSYSCTKFTAFLRDSKRVEIKVRIHTNLHKDFVTENLFSSAERVREGKSQILGQFWEKNHRSTVLPQTV